MLYRPFRPEDFQLLYEVEEVCFEPDLRYSRAYMRQLTRNPESATWIAEDEGKICGFAIVEWTQEPEGIVAYLQTIEVLSEFRGRGAGGRLLRLVDKSALAAGAIFIWLHVDVSNLSAIRRYEEHGYNREGQRADFYASGRHAFIYAKDLRARGKPHGQGD